LPVVGLLTCEVLEDEFSYLILRDPDIARVSILRSDYSATMEENLRAGTSFELVVLQDLDSFKPGTEGIELLVDVRRVALHMVKKELQTEVMDRIHALQPYCDVILLGYGLCGNALEKLEDDTRDLSIPVIMPANFDGSRIDDCVCLILGGTRYYLEEVRKEAGTWFVTPGWLKHWETLLLRELGAKDIKTVKWIFDKVGYCRVLMVNAHTSDEQKFLEDAISFAKTFNFRVEQREGSLQILVNALAKAKALSRRPGPIKQWG